MQLLNACWLSSTKLLHQKVSWKVCACLHSMQFAWMYATSATFAGPKTYVNMLVPSEDQLRLSSMRRLQPRASSTYRRLQIAKFIWQQHFDWVRLPMCVNQNAARGHIPFISTTSSIWQAPSCSVRKSWQLISCHNDRLFNFLPPRTGRRKSGS